MTQRERPPIPATAAGCILHDVGLGIVRIYRPEKNGDYIGSACYVDTHRWRFSATVLKDERSLGGVGWLSNEFEDLTEGVAALCKAIDRTKED